MPTRLSPLNVAALLSRPLAVLPLAPLQPLLAAALMVMRRQHPAVFERLDELGDPLFVIDPIDLPFVFAMRPAGRRPSLLACREVDTESATASIRGPLPMLIDLLEGRLDGDALFFSRELTVEGDTEAVLVLRNAVDSDEINLFEDVLAILGPLAEPLRYAAEFRNAVSTGWNAAR
ncbi:MAG: hypothetical protein HN731_12150 [Rhodospirillaceae bacterium]|jgi:O2-independent ubiquinone biosynthesis accessory factor UbiT|nr:hypothetical protein [Rhodospirillaceae bacterium]